MTILNYILNKLSKSLNYTLNSYAIIYKNHKGNL